MEKILPSDLVNKGVIGLPDTPGLDTVQMQQKFDEIALDVIIPHYNDLVDGVTEALDGKADVSDVPTKTSDLDNDSGFITSEDVNTVTNIVVGETTITAVGEDTVELIAGDNITLTPDDVNKTVTIEATSQEQADWNQSDDTAKDFIKNKPSLATVATSGSYEDLSDTPTVPDELSDLDDVNISSQADGQALIYDSTSQKWVNKAVAGSGDMLASVYDPDGDVATAGGIPDYVADQIPDVSAKADKVSNATNGNFAGLDANGNLTDSGSKASDFSTTDNKVTQTDTSANANYRVILSNSADNSTETAGVKKTTAIRINPSINGVMTGGSTFASGQNSSAGGYYTTATQPYQSVLGKYNDNKPSTLFEVGNGSSSGARSNAFEVYSDGKFSQDNGTSKFRFTQNNGVDGYYDASNVFHAIGGGTEAETVTTLAVDLTSWTSDTTSQSGTTLYKKQISLNHVYVSSPSVDIGAGTGYVLPTSAEQESYDLLQYVTVDDTVPCLYLYASDIPTTAFYISVKGVD